MPQCIQIDQDRIVDHFVQAINCKTVSRAEADTDFAEFERLERVLQKAYPLVHAQFTLEKIGHSLLYSFDAVDDSAQLPVLLLAHMDVVDVTDGWSVDPFAGVIADGYVYGRGTLDMKSQLLALFESLEALLAAGHTLRRGVYIALGHDEEQSDVQGATAIAAHLQSKGLRFACILDEGTNSFATDEFCSFFGISALQGATAPAMVGVCEKGYVTAQLCASAKGGHSSTPPAYTALGVVAKGIVALCEHPMKAQLCPPFAQMVDILLPFMNAEAAALFGDLQKNEAQIIARLAQNPRYNAMVRSTFAPTMAQASDADNVLPQEAIATINVRVAPFDGVPAVLAHIRQIMQQAGVQEGTCEVRVVAQVAPVSLSPVTGAGYLALQTAVQRTFGCLCIPTMMLAATDSARYRALSEHIYRFSPYPSYKEDGGRIHANDERIAICSLVQGVQFMIEFIKELCI